MDCSTQVNCEVDPAIRVRSPSLISTCIGRGLRVLGVTVGLALLVVVVPVGTMAQTRSTAQDPALDNLRHAPGTVTTAPDALGAVRRVGTGARTLILIPGLGFGDGIWTEFMDRHAADYTMFAVTLPGFGGTDPWPMPADGESFAKRPWMGYAGRAIERLMDAKSWATSRSSPTGPSRRRWRCGWRSITRTGSMA
jgi:hypothetical protein